MTVFTTSSPRQISFQIWFLYENPSDRHPESADCCTNRHTSVFGCVCNSERSSMKACRGTIEDNSVGDGRWWTDAQQQELPIEKQRRKSLFFCGNDFEAVKANSEETVRTYILGVGSLCRRNLGSFKWVSHHWKGDSLSLLYTLSVPFFVWLCKHKKC